MRAVTGLKVSSFESFLNRMSKKASAKGRWISVNFSAVVCSWFREKPDAAESGLRFRPVSHETSYFNANPKWDAIECTAANALGTVTTLVTLFRQEKSFNDRGGF